MFIVAVLGAVAWSVGTAVNAVAGVSGAAIVVAVLLTARSLDTRAHSPMAFRLRAKALA